MRIKKIFNVFMVFALVFSLIPGKVWADDNSQTYTLYKGDRYIFTNSSNISGYVYIDNKISTVISYMTYDMYGNVYDAGYSVSNKANIYVPGSGQTIIIIVDIINDSSVNLKANTSFSASKTDKNPILGKELIKGQTAFFENRDKIMQTVWTASIDTTQLLDYVVYDKKTHVEYSDSRGLNRSTASIKVPAGYILAITYNTLSSSEKNLAIYADADYFTVTDSDLSALNKVTLSDTNKSFVYKNIDHVQHTILTNASNRAFLTYIIYNSDETENRSDAIDSNVSSITVPPGAKVAISLLQINEGTNAPVQIGGVQQFFQMTEENVPANNVQFIYPGESRVFTNKGQYEYSVGNNASNELGSYSYVIYEKVGKSDASITSFKEKEKGLLTSAYSLKVPPNGGKLVITLESIDPTSSYRVVGFGGSQKYFAVSEKDSKIPQLTPALKTTQLKINDDNGVGDSYTYTNTDSIDHSIATDAIYNAQIDYAVYNSDGSENTILMNKKPAQYINVPAKGKIVITIRKITNTNVRYINFGGASPFFTGETRDSSIPAMYDVSLLEGNTYQLTNLDSKSHTILTDGSYNSKLDYVIYDKNNNEIKSEADTSEVDEFDIPAQGKLIVTVDEITNPNMSCISFGAAYGQAFNGQKKFFSGKELKTTAIFFKDLQAGKSYRLKNNDKVAHTIINNTIDGNLDYAIYGSNGTEFDSSTGSALNAKVKQFVVPSSGTLVIQPRVNLTIKGPNPYFAFSASSTPALYKVKLNVNKSFTFKNSDLKKAHNIYNNSVEAGKINYITYDSKGKKVTEVKAAAIDTISVPAGGSLKVTVVSTIYKGDSIEFGGVYQQFKPKTAQKIIANSVTQIRRRLTQNAMFSKNISTSSKHSLSNALNLDKLLRLCNLFMLPKFIK